jgi:transposase
VLEPLLPVRRTGGRGRPARDERQVVNGILWILATGCPWRDLPERYGPWQTCYHRFNAWAKDGTWERLYQALLARMEQKRAVDWERWCVDGTSIRALHAAAGARKKGDPLPNRLTTLWADLAGAGVPSSTSRATGTGLSRRST